MERLSGAELREREAQAILDTALAAKGAVEEQLQASQASGDPQATAEARRALAEASEKVWVNSAVSCSALILT